MSLFLLALNWSPPFLQSFNDFYHYSRDSFIHNSIWWNAASIYVFNDEIINAEALIDGSGNQSMKCGSVFLFDFIMKILTTDTGYDEQKFTQLWEIFSSESYFICYY